jgi:hypothetical protein
MVRCGPISWHGVPLGHLLVANWIGTVLGGPGRLSGAPQRIKVKFTAWVGHQLEKVPTAVLPVQHTCQWYVPYATPWPLTCGCGGRRLGGGGVGMDAA